MQIGMVKRALQTLVGHDLIALRSTLPQRQR